MPTFSGPTKVLAAVTTGITGFIEGHGGDATAIFAGCNLEIENTLNPNDELNLHQFCALLTNAARKVKNEQFGLHFGAQFMPEQLGAIGYATICSPTLSSALSVLERYFPVHQDQSNLSLIKDGDIFWLSYHIRDTRITEHRQDADRFIAVLINIFRRALGPTWCPLEVRLEYKQTSSASEHEKVFGAPIQFGRRTNAIAFRRNELNARMPDHDPNLISVIEPFLNSRLHLHGKPETFALIVRNQIRLNLSTTQLTLKEIARLFGLSTAQFQAELNARGLSFNSLLRTARQDLALHYLNESDIGLTEIALMLGYSELSAFSRAFRNWAGLSPQVYRRKHREAPQPRTADIRRNRHVTS